MCSKNSPLLIAITGGIGAGKSVVSNILRQQGMLVYDCDSRAKALMDHDPQISQEIAEGISPAAVNPDGSINRKVLSDIVFNDAAMLSVLNAIVHQRVRDDIKQWVSRHTDQPALWIETAILYQSGLDRMVDRVWEVTAPDEIRIERVMARNSLARTEVEARIASQNFLPDTPHPHVDIIVNQGDIEALYPQISKLLPYACGTL